MDKVQLLHPEGKKAISMDKEKYDILQSSLLACLKVQQPLSFEVLLNEVEQVLKKKKLKVQGKLEWNLFWVTLDLVARKKIIKDSTVSPMLYNLP